MSVTIKAAWIGGGAVVLAAFISGGFALFSSKQESTYNNSGQQIVGDYGTININLQRAHRVATIEFLTETDVHLGDNVYPDALGTSYNPLTQDIYPQPIEGVLFFDKETNDFISDKKGLTKIGVAFAESLKRIYSDYDFSSYKYVHAANPGDNEYAAITTRFRDSDSLFFLGPTALAASPDLSGNFYSRYAAVGYAVTFDIKGAVLKAGIDASRPLEFKVIMKVYHGGIRKGQKENFKLQVNGYSTDVPSKTRAMRDPRLIELSIPSEYISMDGNNHLFLYVLPWEEKRPVLHMNGKSIRPVHFRDVGIIDLGLVIKEL